MYRSFAILAVANEQELRDAQRVRALAAAKHAGAWPGVILLAAGGACFLALGVYGVYFKFTAAAARADAVGAMMGAGFGLGLFLILMAAAFYRAIARCPLHGYLKAPHRYDFVKGELTEAVYLSDGSSASKRILVKGVYGERGLFMEEFDPGVWSNAMAERGEESLKPGDDRYHQKGRRMRLPIAVWVVYATDQKGRAALAGIPSETAALLEAARKN